MTRVLAAFLVLGLAACGQGGAEGAYGAAFQQIRQGIFNRGGAEGPSQFTATRASLQAAGITRPVLVARLPEPGIHVGLVEFQTNRGVTVWRSLDGSTISTSGGILRNTRGFGTDLHSFETAMVEQAVSAAEPAEYGRVYRALDGENREVAVQLYCQFQPEGRERIDVLGRAYETSRFREACYVDGRAEAVFENLYWRGAHGEVWRSRQWAGPELGYGEFERITSVQ